MIITFYSDVRLSPVIYRDARNLKTKLAANSNDNNFSLGSLIQSRNISRRSKFKIGRSQQILTTITFHSEVQLSPVIYRDAQNLKPKLAANSNNNNFSLGSPIESRNILRRSKFKTEARSKFEQQ